jgi:hypothetical protein
MTHTIYLYPREFRRYMAEHRHSDGRQMFRGTIAFEAHDWSVVRSMYLRMRRAGSEPFEARHVITMTSCTRPMRGDRQPSEVVATS